MKKYLLLLLLSLLPVALFAQNRSLTIDAPGQVTAGQSFTVPSSASTDATDGEQIGFYHAEYSTDGGASWTGFCYDVNVGGSATRNAYITAGGAGSTVVVRVRIAFRDGNAGDVDYNGGGLDWGGTWNNWQTPPTKHAYISVVAPPNQPPVINWIQFPASAYVNQWFAVQSRGNDPDGNLMNVWVWKEWVPFAVNGGGNGWESYSDANSTYGTTIGTTINFQTQAFDTNNANSAVIFHGVSIQNRIPFIVTSASPAAINFGQTTTISSTATDPDGNLSFHGLLHLFQNGSNWYRGAMTDHSSGWGNHTVEADILSASYFSGATGGGASSTRSIVHRPTWTGAQTYHSNTHDGYLWASSDAANWANCVGYASVTVNKATPTGTFNNRTLTPNGAGYTVAAGDLNATFANPYSAAVVAPTGTITYTLVGPGTAVTAGTVLVAGQTHAIRATYPGDANYNATTKDAGFTISDTTADDDGDGVPNNIETKLGTNPNVARQTDTTNTTQLKIIKPN